MTQQKILYLFNQKTVFLEFRCVFKKNILHFLKWLLLLEDSAECWFCIFALQCQQTMVNGVISCCASAHISRSSSFSLTRMLYLSRHVYEISENTNFLFHCVSNGGKSTPLDSKACLGDFIYYYSVHKNSIYFLCSYFFQVFTVVGIN